MKQRKVGTVHPFVKQNKKVVRDNIFVHYEY